jgi:hypothetical protein
MNSLSVTQECAEESPGKTAEDFVRRISGLYALYTELTLKSTDN